MRITFAFCFICLSYIAFSQEIPADLLKKMEEGSLKKSVNDSVIRNDLTAKNGKITFTNGETARFKSMQLRDDSVIYLQKDLISRKIPVSDVSLITTVKRHRGYNALVGGGVGLLSGMLVGLLAYPEDNTLATLLELIFQNEDSAGPKLSSEAIPLIIGTTVGGALLGAFVFRSKRDINVVFKNNVSVSFIPEISASPVSPTGYRLTARFRF
jgi:hypothetical protein